MVSGSFAEWHGKRFVSLPSAIESFDWANGAGLRTASPSEGNPLEGALVNDFEFLDSVP
jgi:hypothetical protein